MAGLEANDDGARRVVVLATSELARVALLTTSGRAAVVASGRSRCMTPSRRTRFVPFVLVCFEILVAVELPWRLAGEDRLIRLSRSSGRGRFWRRSSRGVGS
jgi:hypothetical protein